MEHCSARGNTEITRMNPIQSYITSVIIKTVLWCFNIIVKLTKNHPHFFFFYDTPNIFIMLCGRTASWSTTIRCVTLQNENAFKCNKVTHCSLTSIYLIHQNGSWMVMLMSAVRRSELLWSQGDAGDLRAHPYPHGRHAAAFWLALARNKTPPDNPCHWHGQTNWRERRQRAALWEMCVTHTTQAELCVCLCVMSLA